MTDLVTALSIINNRPVKKKKPMDQINKGKNNYMKAFVIMMTNDKISTVGVRSLNRSIESTGSKIKLFHSEATTPSTIERDIRATLSETDAEKLFTITNEIYYSWPKSSDENRLDFSTGLQLNAYSAANWKKVAATTISHLKLWQHCVELNEPIMIRPFYYDDFFKKNFTGGIVGLNDPRGATRKARVFYAKTYNRRGFIKAPYVDDIGEPPVPNGIAGNSAYIIKPWAAQALIDKTLELGIWPNDALMCNQLFPWLQVFVPYITKVQGLRSTTTT
jgi:hypothetical protein